MGESCDWSHRNARDHAHAGAQFGYKANATGPVALERFANKANKVGWNGLPLGVKLLIQNARGTAGTVLPLIPVRGGRDAQNLLNFPRCTGRRRGDTVADAAPHTPDGLRRTGGGICRTCPII